mmetsp:Transcript_6417/g.9450  ORF Transcript_6417/g.9450 Transcript_6417/m.9450 type:complete len:95 (-) Transcript_6417:204-488(-)
MTHLAPYLSQSGPLIKRVNADPATAKVFDVQTCLELRCNESLTSPKRGVIANHVKNAKKKEIQAMWKDRIWGRFREYRLISRDRSLQELSTRQG